MGLAADQANKKQFLKLTLLVSYHFLELRPRLRQLSHPCADITEFIHDFTALSRELLHRKHHAFDRAV